MKALRLSPVYRDGLWVKYMGVLQIYCIQIFPETWHVHGADQYSVPLLSCQWLQIMVINIVVTRKNSHD